jgi:hypothetical protein
MSSWQIKRDFGKTPLGSSKRWSIYDVENANFMAFYLADSLLLDFVYSSLSFISELTQADLLIFLCISS